MVPALCKLRIREHGEEQRNNRAGKKTPPDPTIFPSFLDCDLILIQICPFSDSFLVFPKPGAGHRGFKCPSKKWGKWRPCSSSNKKRQRIATAQECWLRVGVQIFVEQAPTPNGTGKPSQLTCLKKKIIKLFCPDHLAPHIPSLRMFHSHWSM